MDTHTFICSYNGQPFFIVLNVILLFEFDLFSELLWLFFVGNKATE